LAGACNVPESGAKAEVVGEALLQSRPMADAEIQGRIQELRERVDEVDSALIRTLNERARVVQELVAIKAESGVPLFDPKREEEILRRVVELNEGPIYDSSMRDIFEIILHRIRDLEIQRSESR
jgi:chorismate mutase